MTKSIKAFSFTVCICLLFLFLLNLISPSPIGKAVGEDSMSVSDIAVTSIKHLELVPNDIAFDKYSNILFASVPGNANSYANSIVFIDIPSGVISSSIFVGNEPDRLEVADDGSYLYVALNKTGTVKRINLNTGIVDLEFALGSGNCGLFRVEDMVILKDNPESIVISRENTNCYPGHEGVAVYDNGIMRPIVTGNFEGNNEIEPSGVDTIIYGYDNEKSGSEGFGFRHLAITEQGIEVETLTTGLISGFSTTIKFSDGYVYSSDGTVIDPSNNTIHTNLGVEGPVAFNPAANQLLYYSNLDANQYGFRIFASDTHQHIDDAPSQVFSSDSPTKLEYLPPEHLALLTFQRELYIIQLKNLPYTSYAPLAMYDYCGAPATDDFANPSSGWPIINSQTYTTGYVNGEYRIYHPQQNTWVAVTRGETWDNSKLVSADGHLVSGDGVWGLLFALNDNWTDFYTFEILPNDQMWIIFHYQSSYGWYQVASGLSGSIKPGSAVNTLSISKPYSSMQLEINGTVVYFMTPQNGRIGLTGGSFVQSTDIRYDNYVFADEKCPLPTEQKSIFALQSTNNVFAVERPAMHTFLSGQE